MKEHAGVPNAVSGECLEKEKKTSPAIICHDCCTARLMPHTCLCEAPWEGPCLFDSCKIFQGALWCCEDQQASIKCLILYASGAVEGEAM